MRIPFTNVIITRDHVLLTWTKILGLCVLITSGLLDPQAGGIDPSVFGLTPLTVHKIQGIASGVTVLSFWLGMSPLPLSRDHALAVNNHTADTALNPLNSKPL